MRKPRIETIRGMYLVRRTSAGWQWRLAGDDAGWSEPMPRKADVLEDIRLFSEGC